MFSRLRFRNPLQNVSPKARNTLLVLSAIYGGTTLAAILIGPGRIFQSVVLISQWLSAQPHGRLLVLGLIILCSFPPMVGYSNSITLCGLAFGSKASKSASSPEGHSIWEGFALAVTGAMLGSSLAFMGLRLGMRAFRRSRWIRYVKESRQWVAMGKAVEERGFTMILLIRCSPFPFVYSNLFFATLDAVTFPRFFLATLLSTPRLLLHVYIGSVMYELFDEAERAAMPTHVKELDALSITLGIAVGAGTGWWLWRVMNRILAEEEVECMTADPAGPARLSREEASEEYERDNWARRRLHREDELA
ncbi:hypothetical protein K437DRAFT_154888 [Tilletiaria anomala UBC 951]|uniref:Golgi apparatus membrane protein TVP38 n=1 Tax=Tilletiaria anomala (strain ATCC 24038 / CBS 436.72 / UBC 951) TaxID=1037660 RepID=A0A066VMX0_TILAU|nr:uncharacterized protein K437DRAFT_154888 [Tilletiaria anomala UBC 951]KDN43102.1 hypothetical protein K437DRAFT_154888 [Tilletiaria anomala UBC 951]